MNEEIKDIAARANSGDPVAFVKLGEYYLENADERTYREYYEKAIDCFRKSASLGNTGGLYNLGICYENGIGTKQDFNKALTYFLEAANSLPEDDPNIQRKIADCYANKEDFKLAIEWYSKAAAYNDNNAINALGYIYLNGCGIKKDIDKAIEYLSKTAEKEDPYSINLLGTIYSDEKSDYFDARKALSYYEKASELEYPDAMLNASEAYLEGNGCEVNIEKGIRYLLDVIDIWGEGADVSPYPTKWQMAAHERLYKLVEAGNYLAVLKALAANGNRVAQYYIYTFSSNSLSLNYSDQNNRAAQKENRSWLIQSADNGFPNAQYELGQYYATGLAGCEKDMQKAVQYLSAAADQGHSGAIYYLQSVSR